MVKHKTIRSEKSAEQKNLAIMSKFSNYNKWIFNNLKHHIGQKVLEVGGGVGSMTEFLSEKELVVSTDVSGYNIKKLKSRFSDRDNILAINNDISTSTKGIEQFSFDSVVCINVLEHIKDDVSALKNMNKVLSDKGTLVLMVPAFKGIYGTIDRSDHHYRRYGKAMLRKRLEHAGFKDIRFRYMNIPGFFGWFYHGRILKRKVHVEGDLSFFDKLVPFFEFFEKIFKPPFGLSLIAFARK